MSDNCNWDSSKHNGQPCPTHSSGGKKYSKGQEVNFKGKKYKIGGFYKDQKLQDEDEFADSGFNSEWRGIQLLDENGKGFNINANQLDEFDDDYEDILDEYGLAKDEKSIKEVYHYLKNNFSLPSDYNKIPNSQFNEFAEALQKKFNIKDINDAKDLIPQIYEYENNLRNDYHDAMQAHFGDDYDPMEADVNFNDNVEEFDNDYDEEINEVSFPKNERAYATRIMQDITDASNNKSKKEFEEVSDKIDEEVELGIISEETADRLHKALDKKIDETDFSEEFKTDEGKERKLAEIINKKGLLNSGIFHMLRWNVSTYEKHGAEVGLADYNNHIKSKHKLTPEEYELVMEWMKGKGF